MSVGGAGPVRALRILYNLRLKADYSELSVTREEAEYSKKLPWKPSGNLKN